MFFAALQSACSAWPQATHSNPAGRRRFWAATCPQFERGWLVWAGGTAMSIEPHQAAAYCIARVMDRALRRGLVAGGEPMVLSP
jgi:hypothetical protein